MVCSASLFRLAACLAVVCSASAGRVSVSGDPEDQQSAILDALRSNPFLTTTALKRLPPSPLPAWFTIQPSPAPTETTRAPTPAPAQPAAQLAATLQLVGATTAQLRALEPVLREALREAMGLPHLFLPDGSIDLFRAMHRAGGPVVHVNSSAVRESGSLLSVPFTADFPEHCEPGTTAAVLRMGANLTSSVRTGKLAMRLHQGGFEIAIAREGGGGVALARAPTTRGCVYAVPTPAPTRAPTPLPTLPPQDSHVDDTEMKTLLGPGVAATLQLFNIDYNSFRGSLGSFTDAIKAALCPTSDVQSPTCHWINAEAVRVHSVLGPRSVSHAVALFDGAHHGVGDSRPAIEALLDHKALEVRVRFEFDTCNSTFSRTQYMIEQLPTVLADLVSQGDLFHALQFVFGPSLAAVGLQAAPLVYRDCNPLISLRMPPGFEHHAVSNAQCHFSGHHVHVQHDPTKYSGDAHQAERHSHFMCRHYITPEGRPGCGCQTWLRAGATWSPTPVPTLAPTPAPPTPAPPTPAPTTAPTQAPTTAPTPLPTAEADSNTAAPTAGRKSVEWWKLDGTLKPPPDATTAPQNASVVSQWSSWSKCSQSCGTGSHSRNRTCVAPELGGTPCPSLLRAVESCNESPCTTTTTTAAPTPPRWTSIFGPLTKELVYKTAGGDGHLATDADGVQHGTASDQTACAALIGKCLAFISSQTENQLSLGLAAADVAPFFGSRYERYSRHHGTTSSAVQRRRALAFLDALTAVQRDNFESLVHRTSMFYESSSFDAARRAAADASVQLRSAIRSSASTARARAENAIQRAARVQGMAEAELGARQATEFAIVLRDLTSAQVDTLREIAAGNRTYTGEQDPRELYGSFANAGASALARLDAACGKALAWATGILVEAEYHPLDTLAAVGTFGTVPLSATARETGTYGETVAAAELEMLLLLTDKQRLPLWTAVQRQRPQVQRLLSDRSSFVKRLWKERPLSIGGSGSAIADISPDRIAEAEAASHSLREDAKQRGLAWGQLNGELAADQVAACSALGASLSSYQRSRLHNLRGRLEFPWRAVQRLKLPEPTAAPDALPAEMCPHACKRWYDGCQVCSCQSQGVLGKCNGGACPYRGRAHCLEFCPVVRCAAACPAGATRKLTSEGCETCECQFPATEKPCASGCTRWFDGCNSHNCEGSGVLGAGTKKACAPSAMQQPRCETRCPARHTLKCSVEFCPHGFEHDSNGCGLCGCKARPTGTTCPVFCRSWFDGCNVCNCEGDGRVGVCTTLKCAWTGAAQCVANTTQALPPNSWGTKAPTLATPAPLMPLTFSPTPMPGEHEGPIKEMGNTTIAWGTACATSAWGAWPALCPALCGEGHQIRRRNVTQEPGYGAADCPSLLQSRTCRRPGAVACTQAPTPLPLPKLVLQCRAAAAFRGAVPPAAESHEWHLAPRGYEVQNGVTAADKWCRYSCNYKDPALQGKTNCPEARCICITKAPTPAPTPVPPTPMPTPAPTPVAVPLKRVSALQLPEKNSAIQAVALAEESNATSAHAYLGTAAEIVRVVRDGARSGVVVAGAVHGVQKLTLTRFGFLDCVALQVRLSYPRV